MDDLSKHCEFDRYGKKKELNLFRLPSLIAQIFLNESEEIFIGLYSCLMRCMVIKI